MGKCNCFEETLGKIKGHLESQLPVGATEFNASWKGAALFFSGDRVPVNPEIAYQYRAMRRKQTPAKNLTKKTVGIMCSYCPFCGRKLGEQQA
ncbi:hypothetical protein EGH82_10290 [Vibrio ponticus]|uniref:Uncharacterized protein n=1 Tax=Vibrio ponticus TaxID=265668 RepID=A0A3N3E0B9_9VIBR|nr:hypothetical protein [Vibrio ponticus]ROV60184.1 hypothetical protein EGH82_10290 [Vibrio ponticus]